MPVEEPHQDGSVAIDAAVPSDLTNGVYKRSKINGVSPDGSSSKGNSDTLIGPYTPQEDEGSDAETPIDEDVFFRDALNNSQAIEGEVPLPEERVQLRPFKSPSISVAALSRSRRPALTKGSSAVRRSVITTATGHSSTASRHGYNETGTIMIPEAYEKTELAISTGVGADVKSPKEEKTTAMSRHRFSKSSKFSVHAKKRRQSQRYVIPGQQVVEGHHNYILAYNMITGIRVAVSRCSQIPHTLTTADYKKVTKMVFGWEGSPTTPSSRYAFKFKDYAPEVFRDLRSIFNIDQADYLLSLTEKVALTELGSPGKSGSFFYYSGDYRFIIKTIHHGEHEHLLRILNKYHDYVKLNPDTLLCQFYGLHRLKMLTISGPVKLYIVVMNNIFPPTSEINERFDLKGSTCGRYADVDKATAEGRTSVCLKDLNLLKSTEKIHLGKSRRQAVLDQLSKDVRFLTEANIMDYSLLLGKHNMTEDELESDSADDVEPGFLSTRDPSKSKIFVQPDGGVRGAEDNGVELPVVYYMAIIDCLTNYGKLKHLETFVRSLRHRRDTISAVPPREYGQRFYKFMEAAMTPATKQRKND